jgi:hypothetical protein
MVRPSVLDFVFVAMEGRSEEALLTCTAQKFKTLEIANGKN